MRHALQVIDALTPRLLREQAGGEQMRWCARGRASASRRAIGMHQPPAHREAAAPASEACYIHVAILRACLHRLPWPHCYTSSTKGQTLQPSIAPDQEPVHSFVDESQREFFVYILPTTSFTGLAACVMPSRAPTLVVRSIEATSAVKSDIETREAHVV